MLQKAIIKNIYIENGIKKYRFLLEVQNSYLTNNLINKCD